MDKAAQETLMRLRAEGYAVFVLTPDECDTMQPAAIEDYLMGALLELLDEQEAQGDRHG